MTLLRGSIQGDGVSNPMLIPIPNFYGWTGPTRYAVICLRKIGPNLSTLFQFSLDGSAWTTVTSLNGGGISPANANVSQPFNQKAPFFRLNINALATTDYFLHWWIR